MNLKKFLAYCPNCTSYDQDSGTCNYIHENVYQYPKKFIEYCDGKYLSLIKGKKIGEVNESESDSKYAVYDESEEILVEVFNSTDNLSFILAKSLLNEIGIKFWSNGEFIPPNIVIQSSYPYKIKVFEKDENAARNKLDKLKTSVNQVVPSDESDKTVHTFIVRWGFIIIALPLIVLIIIFYVLKK